MTPRKRKRNIGGGGRTRHPNSLANLRRGVTTAPPGNTRAVTYGGYSEQLVADVSAEVRELMDVMAQDAPIQDRADTIAFEKAARALKRWRHVVGWCDLHGRLDAKGEPTSAARYEVTAENQLQRDLDVLGLNPAARAKLGLDIARGQAAFDLARQWAKDGDD
jgi:hypothetical protein